jgi:pyridoxal phosphate enzyme (YggS family)
MSTAEVRENLNLVREWVRLAAEGTVQGPQGVKLLAVSKTVGVDEIRAAYACGQRAFGENRVPDLERKKSALPADCEWHFIGHLQKNKVRPVVKSADWIHSVDSLELLERIERIAAEEGRRPSVLLEVNISGEESKFGLEASEVHELVEASRRCEHLRCCGLMTMAPFGAGEDELHRVFGGLRELRDGLVSEAGVELPELSMGMSGDFRAAIREGSTVVRIGTAIFGSRRR